MGKREKKTFQKQGKKNNRKENVEKIATTDELGSRRTDGQERQQINIVFVTM